MSDNDETSDVITPRRGRPKGSGRSLATPEAQPAPTQAPASDGTLPRGVSTRAQQARERMRKSGNLGGFNTRLHAKPIPGFITRWVNDQEGRIENRLESGWDYVSQGDQGVEQESTDAGSKVSRVVGSHPSGEPMRAYLLKIPTEWYKEDQKQEEAQRTKVDETIRRGLMNAKPGDNRYVPKEGISIKTQTR